jgi:hybrid cluster-associated redox disulfide protein
MADRLADMLIKDVISSHPGAAAVFERHGLGCASCLAAGMESVSAVANVHDVPVEALVAELRALHDNDDPGREP